MKIFGILNITPDSFSDGNQFLETEKALLHAKELSQKCDVIDIGAQSTRPDASIITDHEEISRLGNIIQEVSKFCPTSIDSFNFTTQKVAMEQGVSYINDVCAFKNPDIFKLSPPDVKFIFMHHLSVPPSKNIIMQTQKDAMILEIKNWALNKVKEFETYGVEKNRLIFDIGIGFGKDAEQSMYIVENIEKFLDLKIEIMVGHSRKSFMELIKKNASLNEKDSITKEMTNEFQKKGIHYVRVHKP